MVDFKKITDAVKGAVEGVVDKAQDLAGDVKEKAGDLVESRGGMDGVKEDLAEVKDIATGEGSITDKAKAAVEAIKDPGAADEPPQA
jgi:hypothetical protein